MEGVGVSETTERVSMHMIKEKKKTEEKGKGHASKPQQP